MDSEPRRAVVREKASHVIIQQSENLAAIAQDLANRADEQLRPIARDADPESISEVVDRKELPSLFNGLRHNFDKTEMQLRRLSDLLDRCEV